MKLCSACQKPLQGGLVMGGTPLCRECEPDIRDLVKQTRDTGKPVNIAHIARRYFKKNHAWDKTTDTFPLSSPPGELWAWLEVHAKQEGSNVREIILKALYEYQSRQSE